MAAGEHGASMSDTVLPPPHWTSDVALADGGTVHVRPIGPADADGLVEFHSGLSGETTYLRFFSPHPHLSPAEVERFTHVDHHDRVAFVAELAGHIIGVGRLDRVADTGTAEVAFVVADEHQGRGIGTVLLEELAAVARGLAINRFEAVTLPHNRRMLGVFRDAGFVETERFGTGEVRVELFIEPTERSRAAIEAREHQAEAISIARMMNARTVAVIGAGRKPASVGHQVVLNLLGGFDGAVYPVNPKATSVAGVPAFPRLSDVPISVELAVIAVPAPSVLDALRECCATGVGSVIVLTAGFAETGEHGAADERALRDLARQHGIRLVGPNCVGIVNTATVLNATFSPWAPSSGGVAMHSQSGALGIVLLERSHRLELGVSSFVSVGNRADVSGNDLLQYWEDDPATRVILLYLESVGNPRKFVRIARRVSRRKPIVAVKAGRTDAGARAASSHTAALANTDTAVDALFRQAGIIRVDTVEELFDTARLLDRQVLPGGRRVAIVGNSGGPGVLATDACAGVGLELARLRPETEEVIGAAAGTNATASNPVDLVASATPAVLEAAVAAVLADDGVDAVLVICTATFAAPAEETARIIHRLTSTADKPVAACLLAWPEHAAGTPRRGFGYTAVESAVRALGRAADYAAWRRRDPGVVPHLVGIQLEAARDLVNDVLTDRPDGRWLSVDESEALLDAYGLPQLPVRMVRSADGALTAAADLGYPVVIKAVGPNLIHKSDVGGVRLDLRTPQEVLAAYQDMEASLLGDLATGFVVQPYAPSGVEVIVGLTHDPLFGPLVMLGLGGIATELLGDRSFRILPVTDADAFDLVRSLRASPLLFGYRGRPPVEVESLQDVILRIAQLAHDLPEVVEIDLNPVMVGPHGSTAVDARVRIAPSPEAPRLDVRQLT
jgi:acetyl coenzyme A synthetase (ADP forming)-like protein